MASTAHVGESRALVFPVMCNGYLQLDYSESNTSDYKHNLWGHKDEGFTFEAIVSPYDVNGIGHRTSAQGRLDSAKTPPSPNLSLDDHANTTSDYQSVSYFGSGRNTHKMMLFHNPFFQFYLENTTSSNFNQPAEYKLVCKLISGSKTHTTESDAVITSSNQLKGYYDSEGFYENGGLVSTKTQLTTSANAPNEQATITISGSLASFTNTAAVPATLGTATFTVNNQPGSSHLDTPGSSGTAPTGSITIDSLSASDCFSEFAEENTGLENPLEDAVNSKSIKIFNDGTTAADTFVFVPIISSNMGSARTGDNLATLLTGTAGTILPTSGVPNNNIFIFEITNSTVGGVWQNANNLRTVIGTNSLSANISGLNLYSNSLSGKTVNLTTIFSVSTSTLASYNNTITRGSNLTSDVTVTGMSGGVNSGSATNVNYYMTVQLRNSIGNLVTKFFKFFNTGTNGAVNNSTTSVSPTHIVRVGGNTNTTASNLSSAINSAFSGTNFAGDQASVSGSVVTVTSPSTSNVANQALARVSNYSTIVSVSGSQFGNYVAATPAVTPTAFITITDSAGNAIKYKPSKGHNGESTGSTGTENGGVTYFLNDASSTTNTATNLRTAIASANGHAQFSPAMNASSSSNVVTVTATAPTGSHALARTSNMSSQVTLSSFSGGSGNAFSVSSGEADGVGAGNQVFNNAGVLVGTVSSVSGNNITLTASPATPITSTMYVSQPREALYLEQLNKVSCSFDKRHVNLYLNNVLVQKKRLDIENFEFDDVDCYIGQDGSNTNTQFMGELYEVSMHKGLQPCATISTLTPNFGDTLFYYTFGD